MAHGLGWEHDGRKPKPVWITIPDEGLLQSFAKARLQKRFDKKFDVKIELFAEGNVTRSYLLTTSKGLGSKKTKDFLLRISLPIAPVSKTLSEVGTLQYLREYTKIPVPVCFDHEFIAWKEIGYEWVIVERIQGFTLSKVWSEIPFDKKVTLTQQMAKFVIELEKSTSPRLGSLYVDSPSQGIGLSCKLNGLRDSTGYAVGRHCSLLQSIGNQEVLSIDRGPFNTSYDYISALIATQSDSIANIHNWPQYKQVDDAIEAQGSELKMCCFGLHELRPDTFDPCGEKDKFDFGFMQRESFVFCHNDLSADNIIVDKDFEIVAIVGWEFASFMPRWYTLSFPSFLLDSRDAEETPRESGTSVTKDSDLRASQADVSELKELRMIYNRVRKEAIYPKKLPCIFASSDERDPEGVEEVLADARKKREFFKHLVRLFNAPKSGIQDTMKWMIPKCGCIFVIHIFQTVGVADFEVFLVTTREETLSVNVENVSNLIEYFHNSKTLPLLLSIFTVSVSDIFS